MITKYEIISHQNDHELHQTDAYRCTIVYQSASYDEVMSHCKQIIKDTDEFVLCRHQYGDLDLITGKDLKKNYHVINLNVPPSVTKDNHFNTTLNLKFYPETASAPSCSIDQQTFYISLENND